MKSDDIAPLISAALNKREKIGMRQGTLLSWDPSTGNNTVQVAGQVFEDLPVLASGSVAMAPGDIVALQRYGNSYFILGAIRNAGTGSLQTRSATVEANEATTSTSYTDLATAGPTLTNVYIGASRQCLVLVRAGMAVPGGEEAEASFTVSGASTISVNETWSAAVGTRGAPAGNWVQANTAAVALVKASDGLNQGLNTFTMKYKSVLGNTVNFAGRVLTVIPF